MGVSVLDAKGKRRHLEHGSSWTVSENGTLHVKVGDPPGKILASYAAGQWVCVEHKVALEPGVVRPGTMLLQSRTSER